MSQRLTIQKTGIFLLILLWVYAAASKLLAYDEFENQMSQQPLPQIIQLLLTYTLPSTELFVAALLLFGPTTKTGIYLSAILLSSFTIYIALGLLKIFKQIPCACGGILQGMGWGPHLVLNIFFLALTILIMKKPVREEVLTGEA